MPVLYAHGPGATSYGLNQKINLFLFLFIFRTDAAHIPVIDHILRNFLVNHLFFLRRDSDRYGACLLKSGELRG